MHAPTRPLAAAAAGLGILGALAGCATTTTSAGTGGSTSGSGSSAGTAATSAPAATSGSSTATTTSGSFKDGSYSAEGSYASPAGTEKVKVDLTIASGKVTAVTVTPEATDGTATGYQKQFAGGISAVVVGKDLSSLTVSRVAGSSLTSSGFNAAVATIKQQAAA